MKLRLLAADGRVVWESPSCSLSDLGEITPSIVVHRFKHRAGEAIRNQDVHFLLSGGNGDYLFYRQMNPLYTDIAFRSYTWDGFADSSVVGQVRNRILRLMDACHGQAIACHEDSTADTIKDMMDLVRDNLENLR